MMSSGANANTNFPSFSQKGFTERPFFDRAGGFDERGGPRNSRRDEPANRPGWNATAKDEDRVPANSSEQNDTKDKKASRWGNSSPKSIVSEEENWDDDVDRKNSDNSPIVPLLSQTEPIDDDSDVDFDDGGAAAAAAATAATEKPAQNEISIADSRNENVETIDEPQHSVPLQQQQQQQSVDVKQSIPERFDIFDDNETAANQQQQQEQPATAFNNRDDDKDIETSDNRNESAECNTTPLYDEPEEKKQSSEKDEHNDVEASSESMTNENKSDAEVPAVAGAED